MVKYVYPFYIIQEMIQQVMSMQASAGLLFILYNKYNLKEIKYKW